MRQTTIGEELVGYVFETGSELYNMTRVLIKAAPVMLIIYVLFIAPNWK